MARQEVIRLSKRVSLVATNGTTKHIEQRNDRHRQKSGRRRIRGLALSFPLASCVSGEGTTMERLVFSFNNHGMMHQSCPVERGVGPRGGVWDNPSRVAWPQGAKARRSNIKGRWFLFFLSFSFPFHRWENVVRLIFVRSTRPRLQWRKSRQLS
jgi:hypothetical protein